MHWCNSWSCHYKGKLVLLYLIPSSGFSSFLTRGGNLEIIHKRYTQKMQSEVNEIEIKFFFLLSMNQLMLDLFIERFFLSIYLFTFLSHALSPSNRLHNSFHFNPSIHLVERVVVALEREKSWFKFNSSKASNRNSLCKVMMQWWKRVFHSRHVASFAALYIFVVECFSSRFSFLIILMHNYQVLYIQLEASSFTD